MKYTNEEYFEVKKYTDIAAKSIIDIIKYGVDFSMNKYNAK